MRRTRHCDLCPRHWTGADACGECPLTEFSLEAPPGGRIARPVTGFPGGHAVDIKKADDEVTRHLCCAAQTDVVFAQRLFDHIIRQPQRGIAVSPGVDLPVVLRHACAGRRRRALRECALNAIALLGTLTVLGSIAAAVYSLSAAPLRFVPWALGGMLIGTTLVKFADKVAQNRAVTVLLGPGRFSAANAPQPVKPLLRRRLTQIEELSRGNISIYRKFEPFTGYGRVVGGWSFAIDVEKPRYEGGTTSPFQVHDIRRYVAAQVEALDWRGLEVADRVFVSGRDVWEDDGFVDETGRPLAKIDDEKFDLLLAKRDGRARPYTVIRLIGWDGELALTIFLRFAFVKKNLFIEASHSVLTPLQARFHQHDKVRPVTTVWGFAGLAFRSLGMFEAPTAVLNHVAEFMQDRRALAGPGAVHDPSFNHGASYCVREEASDSRYRRYFQKLDTEMYTKVVEQRVFDALVQFLDDHNVHTGELVERQTTILNNGVLVTGGSSLNAESVAAGQNAQATTYVATSGGNKGK
ncbi:hypothetical protein [Nonomuraea sp. SBT364]|uniref:hypothetical protein n=1 Tax=Nonomuraea sp. SBT364 TaxID=1580530 RepID=UPI00066D03AB|nr:hypothetical protein [Nonomuraea sp. SBT364]